MQDKPVALVTGANQGIGLQIARELAAKDFIVLVGSRDLEKGEEAARTIEGGARAIQLDVTDSGVDRGRGGPGAQRTRPPRRAHQQRGHIAHETDRRADSRGIRQSDPAKRRLAR